MILLGTQIACLPRLEELPEIAQILRTVKNQGIFAEGSGQRN